MFPEFSFGFGLTFGFGASAAGGGGGGGGGGEAAFCSYKTDPLNVSIIVGRSLDSGVF